MTSLYPTQTFMQTISSSIAAGAAIQTLLSAGRASRPPVCANYRQGTLSVDLVDMRRNALIWQGVAEGHVDTQTGKNPGPTIETAIAEIFSAFPDKKEKCSCL